MPPFQEKVYQIVRKIPKGNVSTYKHIAQAVGKPKAYRAVGNALRKNPRLLEVPCHRVVRADGKVGGYALGAKKKIRILKKEGVFVVKNRIDLKRFGFCPPSGGLV